MSAVPRGPACRLFRPAGNPGLLLLSPRMVGAQVQPDSVLPSLYDAAYERASCGLGFVARVDGQRSHEIVESALAVLTAMAHRGASGSDPETGDGAGIMLQIPDAYLRRVCKRDGITLP